jgi:hypothetical protein
VNKVNPSHWLPFLLEADARYRLTSWLFLRLLALIYLAAFFSTALEIDGLVGERGILPAGQYLDALFGRFGEVSWLRFPTLFWIDHSDDALLWTSYLGCVFAVLLFVGWRPLLSLIVLFLLYLSLVRVGQLFFNFQWEYLLLEAGFLSIFLASGTGANRLVVFLLHWLLFRLRFLSGLSKLLTGDPSWASLTTLNHYFETQPLPHMGSWYAHQLPDWLLRTGTGLTLFVELLVPFFIFLPRPFRLFAAVTTIVVQMLIISTSNHNFINLLTIALCLFLLDDRAIRRVIPGWLSRTPTSGTKSPIAAAALAITALLVVPTSGYAIYELIADQRRETPWDHPANWVRAWGLGNGYHIFPTMQTERHELIIEGSQDGRDWRPYEFRYKPNSPDDTPAFIVPLHPRLDWLVWFVPPQNPAMRPWFERFIWRLQQNEPSVTGLLKTNPYPETGPRYLRIRAYRYRFTTREERARTGRVWNAEYLGLFPQVPPRIP